MEQEAPTTKFYSEKAISVATYFGGPLAAGVLIRHNFLQMNKEKHGLYALIIGVLSTLLIFTLVFFIPEKIMDKIPQPLIPGIYTLLIYLITNKMMGTLLKEHKVNNGLFVSMWKAVGIGFVCMLVLLAGIFGYAYSSDTFTNESEARYDQQMAVFNKNEESALKIFQFEDSVSQQTVIDFIDHEGLIAWNSNLKIISELDKLEGLPEELIAQNNILRNYCILRIDQFQLIRKSIITNSNEFDTTIENIGSMIDAEVDKLSK